MIRFNASTFSKGSISKSTKRFAQALSLGLALAVCSPNASAQNLPRSTVEAITISGSHRTQINEFVEGLTPNATGTNAQDVKKAIDALTKPLNERGVSVAFRQAYSQALGPVLSALDEQGTIAAQLAALRLAGDLATPSAVNRIKKAINSTSNPDLGVQLFAVSRAGQVFSMINTHGPALTPNDSESLIRAIQTLGTRDDLSPELLGACVRALSIGTTLPSKTMGENRSLAIIALGEVVGRQLRGLGVNDDPTTVHELALVAAGSATASISDISSDTNADATKAAVGLGGDIISVSLRKVLNNAMPQASERRATVQTIQAGESLLYFALRNDAELNNESIATVKQTKFANQIAGGDDRAFRGDAAALLGPGSPIVKRFGFRDDRFLF